MYTQTTTPTAALIAIVIGTSASAATITLAPDTNSFDTVAGQTGTLQVIIDTAPDSFPFTTGGVGISVASSDPGVIAITDATIFNPEFFGGALQRWDFTAVTGLNENGIDELLGGAVQSQIALGTSIVPDNADGPVDGTFLFAEINYQVIGEGTTTVTLGEITSRDGVFLVSAGSDVTSSIDFGSSTFTVVPEPSSLALIGLGGLLIARRRRG